ncbi:MAG: flippase-like domain-containing protein, partial [Chloroflexota bacterium]|nr:flippase-like domain-containing protein [Chloroflexota bacterium]
RAAGPAPRLSAALLRLSIAVEPIDRYGPSRIAAAAGLSAVAWCMDSAVVWLTAVALSIGISPGVALLITAVTVLGTAVPAAPGYLGTFELALAATAGAFGVPPAQGLALGLLAHAVSLIPITLAGVVSAVVLGVRPRDVGQARGLRTGDPEVREA